MLEPVKKGVLKPILASEVTFCDSRKISCGAECGAESTLEACHVEEIDRPPWSTNETTAPPPEWDTVKWYLYETSNKMYGIALHLTWSQQAKIFDEFVDGYYLVISKLGMFFSHKFKFSLQDIKSSIYNEDIYFEFNCFGRDDKEKILAGDSIYLTMHSLPMYQANTKNLGREAVIHIPDCLDPEMNSTEHCHWQNAEYEYEAYEPVVNAPAPIISETKVFKLLLAAAGIGASIGLFVVGIALCSKHFLKKCKSNNDLKAYDSVKVPRSGSCLVLVSASTDKVDTLYCKAASVLSDILKKQTQLDIMCNLWEHIGMHDPIEWTSKHLLNYTSIVLVCTPLGKRSWENSQTMPCQSTTIDPFVMSINALLRQDLKTSVFISSHQKFHVVYFDDNPSLCVPDEVLKIYDCFKLTEQFTHFFRQLTGHNSHPDLSMPLRYLTNNIQACNNYQNMQGDQSTNLEAVPLMVEPLSTNTDLHNSLSVSNNITQPFDSGFSGTMTNCECEYSTVSSCQGSQCSCQALSIPETNSFQKYTV